MSEVISRPSASRGRGSGRGGRGGFAGRGGRRTNGDKTDHKAADDGLGAFEDEGEFAELRKKYGDKTSVICEMFPDWSEVDVLYVLQETNGDQAEAVTRIAEGTVSQWGEVSKPKKATRPKAKDTPAPSSPDSSAPRTTRGGRNATEGGRGRGRAVERGGRGGRGRSSGPATNGARGKENQPLSVPTEESFAYKEDKIRDNSAEEKPASQIAVPVEPPKPAVKTWASMLRQSTAPKPAPTPPKEPPAPKPVESAEIKTDPDFELVPVEDEHETFEPEPEVELADEAAGDVEATPVAGHATPDAPSSSISSAEPTIELPPPQDELTSTNLQQVADDSKPPATDTAASTAADSWDPRQSPIPSAVIPLSASQQQAQRAAASSGYAATALKATADRTARASTLSRRVLDQEEAVRMPGNREVERAAVQFGAFNLSETDDDIDGEREEPETRAQPPADSPISHPRTSLPPASQPIAVPEVLPQKPLTTAPPPGMAPAAASNIHASTISQSAQPPAPHTQQFGRFGQAGPQDLQAAQPKPLDHFNQQTTTASQPPFDNFANQTTQLQAQQPGVAFSSAPGDYSAYYTANQSDRPYNIYGQHYGQQGGHGQPEPSQQRPYGGYNAAQNDSLSQYPQSGVGLNQPRFGANSESQNSGHSTPNPPSQTQQQAQQQQPQQQGAPPSQPQTHGQQYPGYNHPYHTHPNYYYQYYSGYGQFGPYGKGGMYGQPYGVSPNAPYDHTSSSAAFGPSSVHRDSPLTSGLGDYSRAGAGQANNQPGLGGSSFGSTHESFSRGSHAFQSQGQAYTNQAQPGAGTSNDELKPFSDAKSGSGPSPSLGGPRPGSATNTVPGGQSGSMPPQQSSQVSGVYGVYPSQQHLQGHGLHGSGAYGMGGGGAASQHSTPHGSYGQGGFGTGGYYGAGQQQQGQQQRGWGGNYH